MEKKIKKRLGDTESQKAKIKKFKKNVACQVTLGGDGFEGVRKEN